MAAGSSSSSAWNALLSCQVTVAGESLGALAWIDGGAVALLGTSEALPDLDIGTVFTELVNAAGGSAAWPSSFVDLTLDDTTLYYAFQAPFSPALAAQLPAGVPSWVSGIPAPGLYLASTVTLTLCDVTFPTMDVRVGVASGHGVTISGQAAAPVSLFGGTLTLTGESNGAIVSTAGPTLAVDSTAGSPSFALQTGVQFLGESVVATLDVAKQNGATQVTGSLEFVGALGPFQDPMLQLTWTKADGLVVDGFPGFAVPGVVLDFAKLLQNFLSTKSCVSASFSKLQQALTTTCTVKPKVTTTQPSCISETGAFYIEITGSLQLSVTNGPAVASISLPSLAFAVTAPASFTFDSIANAIATTISAAGAEIFQALWSDRAQLAKFMAVFVGKQALLTAMNEFAGQSACELNKDGNNGGDGGDDADAFDAFTSELEGIADAGASVGAALAAGASAAAAVGAMLGGCGGGGGGGGGGNNNGGGGGGGGGAGTGFAPAVPLNCPATVTAVPGGAGEIVVSWGAVAGAMGYLVKLVDPNRNLVGQIVFAPGASLTIALPSPMLSGTYGCLVQAMGDGVTYTDSPWTLPFGVEQLSAPGGVTLALSATPASPAVPLALTVTCAAEPLASGYVVQLFTSSGGGTPQITSTTLAGTPTNGGAQVALSLSVPSAQWNGQSAYTAAVQAVGGTTASALALTSGFSAPSAPVTIPTFGLGTMAIGSTFRVG